MKDNLLIFQMVKKNPTDFDIRIAPFILIRLGFKGYINSKINWNFLLESISRSVAWHLMFCYLKVESYLLL